MKTARPSRVFWFVLAGVVALILWGEWLEWRRKNFALERVRELQREIEELERD